jgi:3'-5' exoribonuclease
MIVEMADLASGEEGDFFALLADKQTMTTKDGKPYYRVTFRDARRDCSFPIWGDAPLADACRDEWVVGGFYKLRALYRETNYGPQLDIRRIRAVEDSDSADGFCPAMCQKSSQFDSIERFARLVAIATEEVADEALRALVLRLLDENKRELLVWPAAMRNHHAFVGGYLEHVGNVAETALWLGRRYAGLYPALEPALDVDLVVAGAILHDIGKVRELRTTPLGAEYTASGSLIGHVLQGRDMVREAATALAAEGVVLDAEKLLRLEHIVVSHQRLPEWGAPKPPMTPEALLVHFADDCDAKYQMMMGILADDVTEGPVTSRRNILNQAVYRGGE